MNYYEILQVDKKASKEVIDKAFRVLAKKYHPDSQPEDKKQWAEDNFKKLNNAYEILSDSQKRAEYDNFLSKEKQNDNLENSQLIQNMKEVQSALIEKNKILAELVDELQHKLQIYENYNTNYVPPTQKHVRYEPNYEYDRPITHEKHHILKNFVSLLLTVFIVLVVFIVLWYIPFTHDFFVKIYENNKIIKYIVDLFFN